MTTGWCRKLCMFLLAVLFSISLPLHAWAATVDVTVGVGDTTVLFQGSTSPGALVTFVDGGTVVGSTTANAAGEYSQLLTDQTPGLHTYQVYGQDIQGRFADTVSVSVSVQEHAQTTITVFLPPTLQLSDNEVMQGTKVTAEGSAPPGASIILYTDDSYVTIVADTSGNWRHEFGTGGLSPGEHQVYAMAKKSDGEQSYPTQVDTLIVTASQSPSTPPGSGLPGAPGGTGAQSGLPINRPAPPTIASPKPGSTVTSDNVEVVGTAEPGTQIEVWNRDRIVGSTFADRQGNWRLTILLTEYANELKARACRAELCSAFSLGVPLFRQRPSADGLTLRLNRYRLRGFTDEQIRIKAYISGGQKPYKLRVNWGETRHDNFTTRQSPLLLSHRFKKPGHYKGTVTVTDERGHAVQVTFSADVRARQQQWAFWPFLALILLIPLAALLTRYLLKLKRRENTTT